MDIRDRLLPYILITLTVLLSQLFSPEETGRNLSQFITDKLDLAIPIDVAFIGSVIWFGLLALSIRYFQTVICIEGQYTYIHKMEEELSKYYPNTICFTREGKDYLKNYPLFSKWSHFLYRFLFPVLLIIVVVVKIIGEWLQVRNFYSIPIIDSIIALAMVLSTYFYMKTIHADEFKDFFKELRKKLKGLLKING